MKNIRIRPAGCCDASLSTHPQGIMDSPTDMLRYMNTESLYAVGDFGFG